MCSKAEVREVVRENNPIWSKYVATLFSGGIIILLSWLSFTVHNQEAMLEKGLSDLKISNTISNAQLANRIEILTNQLVNIKEVAIARSNDRYTGSQARSRNLLVDERCKVVDRRLKDIEELISKHHIIGER